MSTNGKFCCSAQTVARCAIFGNEDVVQALEESFYVDNCFKADKCLLDKKHNLLATCGFKLTVVSHLLAEAKSETTQICFWKSTLTPKNLFSNRVGSTFLIGLVTKSDRWRY